MSSAAPADAFNIGYVILVVLGAGVLLPWNSFISAVDYFNLLYPGEHIDRVFSTAYMLPSFTTLVLLTFQQHRLGCLAVPRVRINVGLSLYLTTMFLIPIIDALFKPTHTTFYITVAAVSATGMADALVQGSLVGAAGQLPGSYMQGYVTGTALSGVLASCLRIITKAALPSTAKGLRHSANLYFVCSAIFIVACIACYNYLDSLPVVRYHRQKAEERDAEKPLLDAEEGLPPSLCDSGLLAVWKKTWTVLLSLCLMFTVTLSIFPGSLTEDVHSKLLGDWYPVLLCFVFNFCDFIGKTATAYYVPKSPRPLVWGAMARLLFLPIFAFCLHGPVIFSSEISIFIFTVFLAVTSGYFTCGLMMKSPKLVEPSQSQTAGLMSVLLIMVGLNLGSLSAWIWVL